MPDYTDIELAKNKIRTRTSKVLGGYISEHLFEERFKLNNPELMISKGWFGGIERKESDSDSKYVFFVVKETLSKLDEQVKDMLETAGFRCLQVFIGGDNRDIIYVKEGTRTQDYRNFVIEEHLKKKTKPAPQPILGDALIEECINRFDNYGVLKGMAESIYVEDGFLNQYYDISNLDYLLEGQDGKPIYAEVKFKDEFSKVTGEENDRKRQFYFGSDTFQYDDLFKAFTSSGMKVVIFVLYNEVKSTEYQMQKKDDQLKKDDTVIFDYLEKRGDVEFVWKYKIFNPTEKYDEFISTKDVNHMNWGGSEKKEPSSANKKKRGQYLIPLKKYRSWGPDNGIGVFDGTKNPEGTWGDCPLCHSGKRIIIEDGVNQLWGCTNCQKSF
jgi:hypothetical protein